MILPAYKHWMVPHHVNMKDAPPQSQAPPDYWVPRPDLGGWLYYPIVRQVQNANPGQVSNSA